MYMYRCLAPPGGMAVEYVCVEIEIYVYVCACVCVFFLDDVLRQDICICVCVCAGAVVCQHIYISCLYKAYDYYFL